jgi:hypothetical protein
MSDETIHAIKKSTDFQRLNALLDLRKPLKELVDSERAAAIAKVQDQISRLQEIERKIWTGIIAPSETPELSSDSISGITDAVLQLKDAPFQQLLQNLATVVRDVLNSTNTLSRRDSTDSMGSLILDENAEGTNLGSAAKGGLRNAASSEIFDDADNEKYYDALEEPLDDTGMASAYTVPINQSDNKNPLYIIQNDVIKDARNYFWALIVGSIASFVCAYIFFGTKAQDFQDNLKEELDIEFGQTFLGLIKWCAILTNTLFYANSGRKLVIEMMLQLAAKILSNGNWLVKFGMAKTNGGWKTKVLLRAIIPLTGLLGVGATLGHISQMLEHPAWKQVISDVYNWIPNTWGVVGIWLFTKNVLWPFLNWMKKKFGDTETPDVKAEVKHLKKLIDLLKGMRIEDISKLSTLKTLNAAERNVLKKLLATMQTIKSQKPENLQQTLYDNILSDTGTLTENEIGVLFDLIKKIPKPSEVMSTGTQSVIMAGLMAVTLPTYIGLSWSAVLQFPILGPGITVPTYAGKTSGFSLEFIREIFFRAGFSAFLRNPDLAAGLQVLPKKYKYTCRVIIGLFAMCAMLSWVVPVNATLINTHSGPVTLLTLISTAILNLMSTLPFVPAVLVNAGVGACGKYYNSKPMVKTAMAEQVVKELVAVLETLEKPLENYSEDSEAKLKVIAGRLLEIHESIEPKPKVDIEQVANESTSLLSKPLQSSKLLCCC